MITNALEAGSRLTQSSTFWASILLPALKVLSSHFLGIEIPWEVVLAGIGAQGVRNAASHVADGLRDAAVSRADGLASQGRGLGNALSVALSTVLGPPRTSPTPASEVAP